MAIKAVVFLALAAAVAAQTSPSSGNSRASPGSPGGSNGPGGPGGSKGPGGSGRPGEPRGSGAEPQLGDNVGDGNFLVSKFSFGRAKPFTNPRFANTNKQLPPRALASLTSPRDSGRGGSRRGSSSSSGSSSSRGRPAGPAAPDGSFGTNGAGLASTDFSRASQRDQFSGHPGQASFDQGFSAGAGGFPTGQGLGAFRSGGGQQFTTSPNGGFSGDLGGLGATAAFPGQQAFSTGAQQFADPFATQQLGGQQQFAGQQLGGQQQFAGQQFAGHQFGGQQFGGQQFAGQQAFPGQQFVGQQFADPQLSGQQAFPGQQFIGGQQGFGAQQQAFLGGNQQFAVQQADPFAQQGFPGQQAFPSQQSFSGAGGQKFTGAQGFTGQGAAGRSAFTASASAPFGNTAFALDPNGFSSTGLSGASAGQRGAARGSSRRFQ